MKYPKQICESPECGKKFIPIRKDQKFCSPTCANRESQRIYRERHKAGVTA
jgi:hypothetical protein